MTTRTAEDLAEEVETLRSKIRELLTENKGQAEELRDCKTKEHMSLVIQVALIHYIGHLAHELEAK